MQAVIVTTAQPLSAADRKAVLDIAVQKAGTTEVELTERVEASIIGGVVLQVGSRVYDASVRAQFNTLRS